MGNLALWVKKKLTTGSCGGNNQINYEGLSSGKA